MFDSSHFLRRLADADPIRAEGRVGQVVGTVVEGTLPDCAIGQLCLILPEEDRPPLRAEVVGFQGDRVLIMPLGEMRGLKPGSRILSLRHDARVGVGPGLLGRVLDGQGQPIDGAGPLQVEAAYPIHGEPVGALRRERITEPLDLGVRAINGLLTCAVGQRVGIMAGSGVGKSMLLGQIARQTRAEVNVITLVGERGRELREFIERDLGPEGLARSVVISATSDRSPLERVRSAFVATAVAEYFRDRGRRVLLMMDSLTRFAMAQREIGLSIGEPPTTKGYTPSVFALLPRLLERAGMGAPAPDGTPAGSITGLYTVLVDGDDMNEPIADATRAILDGHVVLSRELADRGHYPAIDVMASKSRLMTEVATTEHWRAALRIQELIAAHAGAETLINIGAYAAGSNPTVDQAIRMREQIRNYLCQGLEEGAPLEQSIEALLGLARQASRPPEPSEPAPAGNAAAQGMRP